jgi:hypothetical protein
MIFMILSSTQVNVKTPSALITVCRGPNLRHINNRPGHRVEEQSTQRKRQNAKRINNRMPGAKSEAH